MKPIFIRNEHGHSTMVGQISKDGVFRKKLKKSKHLMKKYNAWGIDAELIQKEFDDDQEIRVLETEENIVYKTTARTMVERGIYDHIRPHGPQIFLPLNKWETYKYTPKK